MDMFQQMQAQHQQSVREMERLHREAVERMRHGNNRGTGAVVNADHSEYDKYKAEIDAFDISDFSSFDAAKPVREPGHSEYQRYKSEIDNFDISDFSSFDAAKPQRQLPTRVERADMLDGINSIEDVKAFFNK